MRGADGGEREIYMIEYLSLCRITLLREAPMIQHSRYRHKRSMSDVYRWASCVEPPPTPDLSLQDTWVFFPELPIGTRATGGLKIYNKPCGGEALDKHFLGQLLKRAMEDFPPKSELKD